MASELQQPQCCKRRHRGWSVLMRACKDRRSIKSVSAAGSFQLPSWLFLRYNVSNNNILPAIRRVHLEQDNPPDDRFDPRRAQSGAQPPQPTQPPQPPRPPPQTERPSPPQQPTEPQQPAPPSTPPAGPTQQPTQPNNPAQPQQPDTETIISTIADSSITVIITRIVETTASRDASNPAETNESSIVSNSNPSTNTRTRTSTLSPEQQDPNSPHYVVPNPSDDPFGLNPTSKPGGNNGPPGGSGDDASGDSRKSNNLGAIIGGIIGGLFLLLLIAGLVYFFILRRRRNRTPPSTAYMAQYGQGDGESRVTSPYPFAQAQQPQPFIPPLMNNRNSIPQSVASGSDVRPESPTLPPRVSTDARLVDVKEYGDYESVDDHAYYTRQSFTRESIGASLSGFSGISNGRSSVAGSSLGYPYRASPSPTPMEAKVVTLRYASGSQVALSPTNQSP
ncbi:hypothetical protein CC1G_01123 [Coprinopsis cinerea okayama7|uniref:Mid2 domain-containing protein n=1 Tax=Coprinopsis cinerea (strain Okayama-7 / 130 / ATCC MYA-4618 / FGSC 9003) TaxID=240176 RepID=A8NEL0_COPC7|nr:hypothetical protein CC1G_01123 [Coprinopsis cinerea okayama7\|eukprot:XP_001833061.2 hypothetical protein CC1G_01123 [Coprinopsis cinerea okayama7\